MKVFLLVGLIIWLGVEIFGLVYRIRIKKELSEGIGWWKSTGNIVYQLSTMLWAALLLLVLQPWASYFENKRYRDASCNNLTSDCFWYC